MYVFVSMYQCIKVFTVVNNRCGGLTGLHISSGASNQYKNNSSASEAIHGALQLGEAIRRGVAY